MFSAFESPNYTIVEGEHGGSLYLCDGYKYKLSSGGDPGQTMYLKCWNRGCIGMAKIGSESPSLTLMYPHSCIQGLSEIWCEWRKVLCGRMCPISNAISARTKKPRGRLNIDPARLRPSNYEIAKSRRGGGIVYICDGYGYRSNKKWGNTRYLICTTRGCKATARFDRDTDILTPRGDHSCGRSGGDQILHAANVPNYLFDNVGGLEIFSMKSDEFSKIKSESE